MEIHIFGVGEVRFNVNPANLTAEVLVYHIIYSEYTSASTVKTLHLSNM